MFEGMQKIEEVLIYMEENLLQEVDCDILARKMNLSVYEFRRIFSFIVGCPISEYIRKRRLSLAACEMMQNPRVNLQDLGEKYGYSSQSAFSKAFKEQHGISPTACQSGDYSINLFTRPQFQLHVGGRETVPLRIISDDAFSIDGYTGTSDLSDSCCCENVWNDFYESGADREIHDDQLYVSYRNQERVVSCTIGQRTQKGDTISASRWACFTMQTIDDDAVNAFYGKIIYEWLPSAKLQRRDNIPTLEVFPTDMSREGFQWEIRIPII